MEFKQMLQKLRHYNRFNGFSITKEMILSVRKVNKSELVDILELVHDTADMESQTILISILTAYVHFNNEHRDIIIKRTTLYDTLSTILTRGLPSKTAVTLNFITSLLYADEDGGSRSRALTLYAQNLIRNSGCLTIMTSLFTNYMLHVNTWIALCRCLAEVCRGSEANQSYCSPLVPFCVQRCLQGNLDVLPVLHSLLFNHKRNIHLFMETEGLSIFDRKEYLRVETCLQLLSTVLQNAEIKVIRAMEQHSRIHEDLQQLLKIEDANLNIVQWTAVAIYYLESKLKQSDEHFSATTKNLRAEVDVNANETQILFQNIIKEIFANPCKLHGNKSFKHLIQMPDKITNVSDVANTQDINYDHNMSNRLEINAPTRHSLSSFCFSFLMEETLQFDQHSLNNNIRNNKNRGIKQNVLNSTNYTGSSENLDYDMFCETLKTFNSKCGSMSNFKPNFISTPKRSTSKRANFIKNPSNKTFFTNCNNKSKIINRTIAKRLNKKGVTQEKDSIKNKDSMKRKSMSSRLFEAINESCTTVIRSVKNVFTGNKNVTTTSTDADSKSVKDADQKSLRSYSFTSYMERRGAELEERNVNNYDNSKNTTLNMCHTCDDTLLLQKKFASDELLRSIVKKLKLGINLYGCDFKRISKTMWPRETYMTPNVLYNLYRKILLK